MVPLNTDNFFNGPIWHIDWTLTSTFTLGQNRPGSNGNKGVPHTRQNSRTEASPPDGV